MLPCTCRWFSPFHGCPWEHKNYAGSKWKQGVCDNQLYTLPALAGRTKHSLVHTDSIADACHSTSSHGADTSTTVPCPASGGTKHKTSMAKEVGVWFVDSDAQTSGWQGARAVDLVISQANHTFKAAPSLPCSNEMAWLGL